MSKPLHTEKSLVCQQQILNLPAVGHVIDHPKWMIECFSKFSLICLQGGGRKFLIPVSYQECVGQLVTLCDLAMNITVMLMHYSNGLPGDEHSRNAHA
jgi:hypothetical protein